MTSQDNRQAAAAAKLSRPRCSSPLLGALALGCFLRRASLLSQATQLRPTGAHATRPHGAECSRSRQQPDERARRNVITSAFESKAKGERKRTFGRPPFLTDAALGVLAAW